MMRTNYAQTAIQGSGVTAPTVQAPAKRPLLSGAQLFTKKYRPPFLQKAGIKK